MNNYKTYESLLDIVEILESEHEEISNSKLWSLILNFLEIKANQNTKDKNNSSDIELTLMKYFLSKDMLSFDTSDKKNVLRLKNIDLNAMKQPLIEINKKFNNYLAYNQEECFKIDLLEHNFKNISEKYIDIFYKYCVSKRSESKLTNKEKALKESALAMINYFIVNDISKLKYIYSFSNKKCDDLWQDDFLNVFKLFENTTKRNDVIAAYLIGYIDHHKLEINKDISEKNMLDRMVYNYYVNNRDHWSIMSLEAQANMFSKIYLINYNEIKTSIEFKEDFKNFISQVIDSKSKDENKKIDFLLEERSNLSLPIIEYCSEMLPTLLQDVYLSSKLEKNYNYLIERKLLGHHCSISFDNETEIEKFMFQTLFNNMILYRDIGYHKRIANIYQSYTEDINISKNVYVEGYSWKSLKDVLNLLNNLFIDPKINCYDELDQKNQLVVKMFTFLDWIIVANNKETIIEHERYLLLYFINMQNYVDLPLEMSIRSTVQQDFDKWLESCLIEIESFPFEVRKSMTDSFNNVKEKINDKNHNLQDNYFAKQIYSIISNINNFNSVNLYNICTTLEEMMLLDIIPINNNTTRKIKF